MKLNAPPSSLLVAIFHRALGLPVGTSNLDDTHRMGLRKNLIEEEMNELFKAVDNCDRKAIMKEAADVKYVVEGLLVELGLDSDEAFGRVHKSNMTKLPKDGKIRMRADGKILKPDTYEEPDLEDLL